MSSAYFLLSITVSSSIQFVVTSATSHAAQLTILHSTYLTHADNIGTKLLIVATRPKKKSFLPILLTNRLSDGEW